MRIVPIEATGEPSLAPDLVWDGCMADFALAEPDEIGNRGGLRAKAHLETAVLICLMTDARADPSELRDGDVNRGWPGDTFDMQGTEKPLGSKLWLLKRSTVDAIDTPRRAEEYALEALQTLIDQKAVASVEATATADPAGNRLSLSVQLYERGGQLVVAQKFALLWDELNGIEV